MSAGLLENVPPKVHFIGIGGVGMSALAFILLERGHKVSGSDVQENQLITKLRRLGATIYLGHRAENLGDAGAVVYSSAIKSNNPELVRARQAGIPTWHRGELLARLVAEKKTLTVVGAHGKTTTTAMIAQILLHNNYDPSVLLGGVWSAIDGNARCGQSAYLVTEADESDGSFLLLKPQVAVITNIENDHLDYYGSEERIKAAFAAFLERLPAESKAIVCIDDAGVREVAASYRRQLITYGTVAQADYFLRMVRDDGNGWCGEIYRQGILLGQLELTVPGWHNLLNATGAVAAAEQVGIPFSAAAEALRSFKGVGRRFQLIGKAAGVQVYDDYAHHPTEIQATIAAARRLSPGRVVVVFQPHRYSRTYHLHRQFGPSFRGADLVIVTNIYSAGEDPLPGVDARLIVDAAREAGCRVVYLPEIKSIVPYLLHELKPGDLVLTMGAGNIWQTAGELVAGLGEGGNGR